MARTWKPVVRPQPPELDLGDSATTTKQSAPGAIALPVNIKQASPVASISFLSASTKSPTTGERTFASAMTEGFRTSHSTMTPESFQFSGAANATQSITLSPEGFRSAQSVPLSPEGFNVSGTPLPMQSVASTPSSGMPVSGMRTTTARQAAITAGQYPPGVGWTPVAKQAPQLTFSLSRPLPSPTGSLMIQTPKSVSGGVILHRTISETAAPFPPGLGYTPLAAAGKPLSKISPFGISDETGDAVQPRNSFISATPSNLKRAASLKFAEEGMIEKELFLIFRDTEATSQLSSEQAGFVWPQPGWILTRPAEDLSPSAKPASAQEAKLAMAHATPAKVASKAAGKAAAAPKKVTKAATEVVTTTTTTTSKLQASAPVFTPQQPQPQQPIEAGQRLPVGPVLGTAAPPGQWWQSATASGAAIASPVQSLGTQTFSTPAPTMSQGSQVFSTSGPTAAGVSSKLAALQSLGSQQLAATQSLGAQQYQRYSASPVQSLGATSFATAPTQYMANGQSAVQQQPRYQQKNTSQDWWSYSEGTSWQDGNGWSWDQQQASRQQQNQQQWANGGAKTKHAGKGKWNQR